MTEYELLDSLNSTAGLLSTYITTYLSLTTAYLIAAYVVGANLTRLQCSLVTVLYLVSAGVMSIAMVSAGTRVIGLGMDLGQINPVRAGFWSPWVYQILAAPSAHAQPHSFSVVHGLPMGLITLSHASLSLLWQK